VLEELFGWVLVIHFDFVERMSWSWISEHWVDVVVDLGELRI